MDVSPERTTTAVSARTSAPRRRTGERRVAAWLVPTVAAVLAALVPLVGTEEPATTLRDYATDVERRIPELMARDDVPGVAIAVAIDGELTWSQGFGVTARQSGQPVEPDTVFNGGSIAKPVTAWAVLYLAEQGAIDLDAPVGEQLGQWQLPDAAYPVEEVTPARLLAHSGGLPFAVDGLPTTTEQLRDGQHERAPFEVVHEPGTGFVYSNPGYVVLGLLVEEAAGEPIAPFVDEHVLAPLGMHDSSFELTPQLAGRSATGHTSDGVAVPAGRPAPVGAGGLHTTAPDLVRFATAAHHRDQRAPAGRGVLRPDGVARLHEPFVDTAGMPHRLLAEASGLGHFVETLPQGHRAVSHGGEDEGWIAGYVTVPDTGDALALMTNSRNSYPLLIEQLAAWAEWRGHGSLHLTRRYEQLTIAARAAIGLLAGTTLVLAVGVAARARTGRTAASGSAAARVGRVAQLAAGALLLLGWWAAAARMLGAFLPHLTPWLSAALTACGLAMLASAVSALTARRRTSRRTTSRWSESKP